MRKAVLMISLVMMLGVVAAHGADYKERFVETRYYSGDSLIVKNEVFVDYDNDRRHSTWNYRHGYSYRATRDYFERVNLKRVEYRDYERVRYREVLPERKGYYYEYVPHMRSYEKRECYVTPPADKLFYVKC